MKKVLVTGATGFVGQHVIKYLLHTGVQVIATARTEPSSGQVAWLSGVQFVPFDISSDLTGLDLHAYFGNPDIVIHLAWQGLSDYKSLAHVEIYWLQHYRFLTNLISNGLTSLTVTGTCLEYGLQSGCLSEDLPTQPITAYGLAKDILHKALNLFIAEHSISFKWVRLFYMHGRGQNPKSLLAQLETAALRNEISFNMSKGEQLRDYLPVTEAAKYLSQLSHLQGFIGTINCCSGDPVSVRTLVEKFLENHNYNPKLNLGHYSYPDYEPLAFWGDSQKLISLLGQ